VLLVEGSAGLEFAGTPEHRLERGDHLLIPAGTPHRVTWTDPDRATVWLAVHLGEPSR
jgi:cupin 2 domain-containing protein